jgi:hypothetical protein
MSVKRAKRNFFGVSVVILSLGESNTQLRTDDNARCCEDDDAQHVQSGVCSEMGELVIEMR